MKHQNFRSLFRLWANSFWHSCHNCVLPVWRNILMQKNSGRNIHIMKIFLTMSEQFSNTERKIFKHSCQNCSPLIHRKILREKKNLIDEFFSESEKENSESWTKTFGRAFKKEFYLSISSLLSHLYSLVRCWIISPYTLAVKIPSQSNTLNRLIDNLTLFCIFLCSSKVLAWVHAISLFARFSNAHSLRLIKINRRYNAAVLTESTASTTE